MLEAVDGARAGGMGGLASGTGNVYAWTTGPEIEELVAAAGNVYAWATGPEIEELDVGFSAGAGNLYA